MASASDVFASLINAGFSAHTAANLTPIWGHETGGTYANSNGLSPDAQAGAAFQQFKQMGLDPQNASISEIARQLNQ